MAQRHRGVRSILILTVLFLGACGGGSGDSSSGSPSGNPPGSNNPPAEIEGVATPSSVSVVTATNAS